MGTYRDFAEIYEKMPDARLLDIASEGGLVDEAESALDDEFRRRNLKKAPVVRAKKEPLRARLRKEASERELPFSRSGGQASSSSAVTI